MDAGTRAPRVDSALRTSAPGVFAAGNLLHGAETAGVCPRDGAAVARGRGLAPAPPAPRCLVRVPSSGVSSSGVSSSGVSSSGDAWPAAVPIECEAPLRWISPNAVVAGETGTPQGHFVLRSAGWARRARISVDQDAHHLGTWTRRLVPNRPVHLGTDWLARVEPDRGSVRISVTADRRT